jgi:hypothetical protein
MDDAGRRQHAIDQVTTWLRALIGHEQITELRALNVRRRGERMHTESGFFDYDHLPQMAEHALTVTSAAKGVYFTMNPLKPDILARRANRLDWAEEGTLAGDKDVIGRRWLLIDTDPVRDAHVSSSDAEKLAALETVKLIRTDLAHHGWPTPILGDSGNGYHLLYRIDLPADDGGVVQRFLQALAKKYDNVGVHVDQKVFNPARICKVPGTLARKGDHVQERPHRRAKLLEVPA